MKAKMLTVRNEAQAALFDIEIRGQISDGHWENASPRNHWVPWCECKVEVGPNVGRDFYVRRDYYGLTSPALLKVVGARMLVYVRLAKAFGREHVGDLERLFNIFDDDCSWRGLDGLEKLSDGYDGLDSGYWNKKLEEVKAKLQELGTAEDDVRRIAQDPSYDRKALRKDLLELRDAMRTCRV